MTQVLDCDEWRRSYHAWTVADHKAFYAEVYATTPRQAHHALDLGEIVFEMFAPSTVIELGGWDGELAVRLLERYETCKSWTNVEICQQAVELGRVHPRYHPLSPDTWFWEHRWEADMFVASHCIEHMTAEHLRAAINAVDVQWIYFDAPLEDEPSNWWGTTTTHILEVGWDGVTEICREAGYVLTWAAPHVTPAESGGYARAVVYTRARAE